MPIVLSGRKTHVLIAPEEEDHKIVVAVPSFSLSPPLEKGEEGDFSSCVIPCFVTQ